MKVVIFLGSWKTLLPWGEKSAQHDGLHSLNNNHMAVYLGPVWGHSVITFLRSHGMKIMRMCLVTQISMGNV